MIGPSLISLTASKPCSSRGATVADDSLSFPLETLLSAGQATRPLDVCRLGHLRVSGRTCWRPLAFEPGPRAVICEPVDVHD